MRKIEFSVVMIGVAIMVPTIQVGHDVLAQEQKKQQPPHKNVRADIEKLVQELGSESGTTRETATKSLLKIGEEALPFLAAAFKSPDLEVRRRAVVIHTRIFDTVQEQQTQKSITEAMAMGIDHYFERIVKNRENLTKDDWKTLVAFANYLRADANSRGYQQPQIEYSRYLDFPLIKAVAFNDSKEIISKRRLIAESATLNLFVRDSFVVCRHFVSDCQAQNSVIFATGRVNPDLNSGGNVLVCSGSLEKSFNDCDVIVCRKEYAGKILSESAILCFGDIRVKGIVHDNHIICHGNVVMDGTVTNNVILAKGDVTLRGVVADNVLSAQGTVNVDTTIRKNRVIKLERIPDTKIKFFTPSLLGAEMMFETNHARVTKIFPNSVLSIAGIARGDKILSIGSKHFGCDDDLVALLRRQSLEKETIFAIRRGDQEIQIKVRFHRSEN